MNREQIYSALFDKLAALDGFVTKSRRLQHWNDVDQFSQPAIFMAQGNQLAETVSGNPSKWRLQVQVYIYVYNEDVPATQLNPLLDAVCNAINEINPITGRTTLPVAGVEYCRVSGTIETDEGTLGSQAVAIIPIEILAIEDE